jgi:alkylhydroperoxidase/carboxymuconolactone decarboxylase family protein YurZ
MSEAVTAAPETFLRRLAAGDEHCLRLVLSPSCQADFASESPVPGLDRRTATLVQLAALVAVDAPTASLRWTVERACALGVSDEAVVAVLVNAARATGSVQLVSSAPRLALALGFDTDVDAPDEG